MKCKWCEENMVIETGEECDRCWELRFRIEENLELAKQILDELSKEETEE